MDDAALDAWIDAGTAALGLPMKEAWREAVRLHMRISLGHATTVLEAPIDDHLEQAPEFKA
ncbi:MAG: DUF4089 domain-containing protein [Proteobacteria bacterium]|nr:DUF4089 domain-containing protein [Pseudomonadota bacterium]